MCTLVLRCFSPLLFYPAGCCHQLQELTAKHSGNVLRFCLTTYGHCNRKLTSTPGTWSLLSPSTSSLVVEPERWWCTCVCVFARACARVCASLMSVTQVNTCFWQGTVKLPRVLVSTMPSSALHHSLPNLSEGACAGSGLASWDPQWQLSGWAEGKPAGADSGCHRTSCDPQPAEESSGGSLQGTHQGSAVRLHHCPMAMRAVHKGTRGSKVPKSRSPL